MKQPELKLKPIYLTPKQMHAFFGYTAGVIYNMISAGKIRRGDHYRKAEGKVLINVEKFEEWIEEKDNGRKNTRHEACN